MIYYIADISQDIDDLIAIDFLHKKGVLNGVVLDGKSNDYKREQTLLNMNINILEDIPQTANIVFCGGALTKVASYLRSNSLNLLFLNGGFAGSNIVKANQILKKFKGVEKCRTYNLNLDTKAALEVFKSKKIKEIFSVSKNVCHSSQNTFEGIHSSDTFLKKYHLRSGKRLHDLLMAKEGLSYIEKTKSICFYQKVDFICDENGIYSKWSSKINPNSKISISVGFLP